MSMYQAPAPGSIQLLPGDLYHRYSLINRYMMSLESDKLLLNHYNEAGLIADTLPGHTLPEGIHKGWESPTCQLRGHFLGHYLSACAWGFRYMSSAELKGRGDHIVKELYRCQQEQGDGWVFSIPRQYMDWIARGKRIWAPQYTMHKTLMGLMDMYNFAENTLALTVAEGAAEWLIAYSGRFSEEEFDEILDVETGGMMEFFADLFAATGKSKHREMMDRYYRRRLFDPLMKGEDVLTNMHANTTIPEVLGCARAYEVTGENRYLEVVLAYWDMAVTKRGYFVTGGQTCYEAWTPPFIMDNRLNEDNQEHCTVYNMSRLADFLFRCTGDVAYQDYIERNYQNGILAQQHTDTGMVGYYLPMQPGAKVKWGTPTENFWCCHGTLVQTHMIHARDTLYEYGKGVFVAQYRPVSAALCAAGHPIKMEIREDYNYPYSIRRPVSDAIQKSIPPFQGHRYRISLQCAEEAVFTISLRIPWWVKGQAEITVNGQGPSYGAPGMVVELNHPWKDGVIEVIFPSAITVHPLPDNPSRVAFMDGPDVLVGKTTNDALLLPNGMNDPVKLIHQESRKGHFQQAIYCRTLHQAKNIEMIHLSRLRAEESTMYFTLEGQEVGE